MNDRLLTKSLKILFFLILTIVVLYYGKPFLVPLVFAGLFSMLLLPVTKRFEKWGINRGLSILLAVLLFVALFAGLISLLVWQVSDIGKNANDIEKNVNVKLQQLKDYVSETFGISRQKQTEMIEGQQQTSGGKITTLITGTITSLGSLLTDFLLTIVYMFLLLYYRMHLKKFILMQVPKTEKKNTEQVIFEARGVAQKYLTGLSWMILCLWIMYGIGFSIVGVKNAIFFAILCGLLEIVPFVGNLTGTGITMLSVLMQGGSSSMIIGVLVTYGIVQFLQTYILEPLVVGEGVSINPLFTIMGIVAGEMIWGIPGMILAIPSLGIIKIICDHIEPLKPYGYLIGSEKKANRSMIDKVKDWVK